MPKMGITTVEKTNNNKKGFSLIEILIAISLIAILSAVSATAISALQKSTRDGTRKTDISKIQSALSQYYADQHFYPSNTGALSAGSPITNCTSRASCTVSSTYLNAIPTAPSGNYYYRALPLGCTNSPSSICLNYCIFTSLENAPGTPVSAPNCTLAGTGYNFVVTQP